MASSEIDTGQLSQNQQVALEQYTAVTNQEPAAAILLLQRSQWNIQVHPPCSSLILTSSNSIRLLSQSSLMVKGLIQLQKL
jgi:hypothetical protein